MKGVCSILVFLFLASGLPAQSEYFNYGESGTLIQANYSKGLGLTGKELALGIGKRGGPEAGFLIGSVSGVIGFGVHFGFDCSVRESPIGFKIGLDLGAFGNGYYKSFGGVLYLNSPDGKLIPSLGVSILGGQLAGEVKLRILVSNGPISLALIPAVGKVSGGRLYSIGLGLQSRNTRNRNRTVL